MANVLGNGRTIGTRNGRGLWVPEGVDAKTLEALAEHIEESFALGWLMSASIATNALQFLSELKGEKDAP